MTVHVRFAPSPTGRIHPGNGRTALVNALFARKHGGRFTLRIDDTDTSREVPGAVDAIRRDLAWLGTPPDGELRQSERTPLYAEAAERLLAGGHAYRDGGTVRLALGAAVVTWHDAIHGAMRIDLRRTPDPVLLRNDGTPTYVLASCVDDVATAISHVIRGDDHLSNTAVHLKLIEALGAEPPIFAHLPLVVGKDGGPLSKRDGAVALDHLRELGVEAPPLVAYLVGLGTGHTLDATADLAASLSLDDFGRAAPVFDPSELARAQERWLVDLPVETANNRLEARGLAPVAEELWHAIRGNLADKHGAEDAWTALPKLDRVPAWQAIVAAPFQGTIAADDAADLATAASLLDDTTEPKAWLEAVTAATGRKGKRLLLPLRHALTARSDGPPIADLIALIGHERARRRLSGDLA